MLDGFKEVDEMFDNILKEFPQKKKELVENIGKKMHKQVIDNISSVVKEGTGDLKASVTKVIGSEGGYAAVRPDYSKAPHSHLVENGHKIIRDGKVIGWVNGKHMYRNALDQVSDEVEDMANNMIDELVGEIDG